MKKLAMKIGLALSIGGFILLIFFIVKFFPHNQIIKEAEASDTISCSVTPYVVDPGNNVTISAVVNFTADDVWAVIEGDDGVAQSHYSLTENDPTHYSKTYATSSSATGQYDIGIFATVDGSGDQVFCNPSPGSTWLKKTISSMPWHRRSTHETLSYNGSLYILGGFTDDYSNDVWSSTDGQTWTLKTASAPWAGRAEFGTAVFDNKMWIFGGYAYTAPATIVYYHDVWSSTDGINWTQAPDANWTARSYFATSVFDNKIWMTGGWDGAYKQDVWYTTNPACPLNCWTQATAAAGFGLRALQQMVTYDDGDGEKLWLLAGNNNGTLRNDVWNSSDGATWNQIKFCQSAPDLGKKCAVNADCTNNDCATTAPWGTRSAFSAVVYNNQIVMMGGITDTPSILNYNDVWSYGATNTWTRLSTPPDTDYHNPEGTEPSTWVSWAGRAYFKSVVHDPGSGSEIFLIGGVEYRSKAKNDVWHSADGANWTLIGTHYDGIFNTRWDSTMAGFDNNLWILGGEGRNDTWYSADGTTWTKDKADGNVTIWTQRSGLKSLVYDNKLWVIGGCSKGAGGSGAYCGGKCSNNGNACTKGADCPGGSCNTASKNDVWWTDDGTNWTQATAAANFAGRYEPATAVYDNKMWIFGGDTSGLCVGGTYNGQICRSNANCTAGGGTCSDICVAGANIGTACAVDGDCGGAGNCGKFLLNDALYSTDGITWTMATAATGWNARTGHSALGYNGKLWVMGGWDGNRLNDVWNSTDGIAWTQAVANADWDGRYTLVLLDYDDKMWVFGGNNGYSGTIPGSRMDSNNVWWSVDGVTWTEATDWAEWDGRDFFAATVFDNRMWLMGGDSMGGGNNDVWASRYADMTYFVLQPQSGQINITAQVEPEISLALSGNTCSLGTLTVSDIQTCGYSATVATNAVNGYTGAIKQDQGFKFGTYEISAASDFIHDTEALATQYGEYGIGVNTTDTASYLPTYTGACGDYAAQHVADLPAKGLTDTNDHFFSSYAGPTDGVTQGVTNFCHGTRIKFDTPPGSYSHTVTITVIGNF